MLRIPPRLRALILGVVTLALIGGAGWGAYSALDPLYPQELWRYFRPVAVAPTGTVLYRDLDGQLFMAPFNDLGTARRLLDVNAAARGREFVRDAVFFPDRQRIAYFATVRRDNEPEQDRVKVMGLDGRLVADIPVSAAAMSSSISLNTGGPPIGTWRTPLPSLKRHSRSLPLRGRR